MTDQRVEAKQSVFPGLPGWGLDAEITTPTRKYLLFPNLHRTNPEALDRNL
jgi:hypothetical protein